MYTPVIVQDRGDYGRAQAVRAFKAQRTGGVSATEVWTSAWIERCGVGQVTGTATTPAGRFAAPSRGSTVMPMPASTNASAVG